MRDVGTLLEALPYIREFHGKTVVIKYGGAAMTDAALPGAEPLVYDIAIEGTTVCSDGIGVDVDIAALEHAVSRDEVEYVVGLPGEGHETEVFFSDLGHGYVTINADYTT